MNNVVNANFPNHFQGEAFNVGECVSGMASMHFNLMGITTQEELNSLLENMGIAERLEHAASQEEKDMFNAIVKCAEYYLKVNS
ncbi:hypothetical protein AVV30_gp005 [Vibrio phage phi 1]|uniref:Uncharacterized protein n=1 Tax=Vibrio phage phi 1 TaxID=1589297 RepID=A0A0B5H8H3_9CAUD|nr:hypothetical protein AVV30_gp005 [Vibrio phage phi 1]AJF40663.1 hypothetical protein SBVP1_0005 [Vibrio phage phi 1]